MARKTDEEKLEARQRVVSLIAQAKQFRHDPFKFVMRAFPWGSGELDGHAGPDEWQADILRQCATLGPSEALRIAVASGHGIGKSALVAWLILWAMTTFEGTRGVITANTETQLRTKTWAELAKWYQLCEFRDALTFQATSIFSALDEHEKTWRIDMVPWTERNTEAFAGLHNQGKRIIVLFDEASAIPDVIWETSQGALTDKDTEILWCVFGNPTRPSGRFFECFNKYRNRWTTRQIDSRSCKLSNKTEIAKWITDEGEDSDYIRIRVRGVFPRRGSMQFLSLDVIDGATKREAAAWHHDPCLVGVDVARYGDDQSVICIRRGRDARTWAAEKYRKLDTMTFASRVAQVARENNADAIFVDGGGVGGGVVDRLRQLGVACFDIQFGGESTNPWAGVGHEVARYANKRAEMWGTMREWLKTGGAIPDDLDLRNDLSGVEYGYNMRDEIQLEKKEDMKKRGLASPDYGDALALTFAFPVVPKAMAAQNGSAHVSENDPYRLENV